MASERVGRLPTLVLVSVVPLVALVAVLVTLNATSDGTGAAATGTRREPRSGTVIAIRNFRYSPDPVTVKVGAAVTVSNRDGTVHTLTADGKQFDTGTIDGGAVKTITVTAPGTYTYHCDVHNYMTGKLVAR